MKNLIFILLSFITIQSSIAQNGSVGELKEIKKSTTTNWRNHQQFQRFSLNGETYVYKSFTKANDGVVEKGDFYKIDADGKETFIRNFTSKKNLYTFFIAPINNKIYLIYLDWSARFVAFDILAGTETVIDELKFNTQEIKDYRFAVSGDGSKIGIAWICYLNKFVSVYDNKFTNLYKYEKIKIPGTSDITEFKSFNIMDDGASIGLMGNNVISGFTATKESVTPFESFIKESKEYQVMDLSFENNLYGKNYILGTAKHKKNKTANYFYAEVNPLSVAFDYKIIELKDVSLSYIYEKSGKELITLMMAGIHEVGGKPIMLLTKFPPYLGDAALNTYDFVFVELDSSLLAKNAKTLYFRAISEYQAMTIKNNKFLFVYNDAKNHLDNMPSTDFADFSYISDRKNGKRESAIYAASYDVATGEIKKQVLLESDDKSNLINRFSIDCSDFKDNTIVFDVIQGEFKKGAGADNMEWKTYEFTFK